MTELYNFKTALMLSDQLTNMATKEDLAECARLLAFNVAHYESKYGSVPLDETLEMAYAEEPNNKQFELMTRGLETLIGILGGIVQGLDSKPNH